MHAGLREGELLGLQWQDVDLARGSKHSLVRVRRQLTRTKAGLCFTSPKGDKTRSVRLTLRTVEALGEHRKRQLQERLLLGSHYRSQELVFASTTGTPIDVANLTYRFFRPLLERAGLPRIRFHDLRHTFATTMLSRNVNRKVVQEMLGHANISLTMDTYSHFLPDMQETAVDAMQEALP